jgi:hypothetical protein
VLKSWRATYVGNIRLQLTAAWVVIYELDVAQESRQLSQGELDLRCELMVNVLGLASLDRTMARQRTKTWHLKDGDACTKYFHLQACRIDLGQLDLPQLDLSELEVPFKAEEGTRIVRETPADRAPGPNRFNGAFYMVAWEIIVPMWFGFSTRSGSWTSEASTI